MRITLAADVETAGFTQLFFYNASILLQRVFCDPIFER
jgi:hypothetical protein